jgi:hypothetical protein
MSNLSPAQCEALKRDFATWAGERYRTRKPTQEERDGLDGHSMETYKASTPLLVDAHPRALECATTHFNALIDVLETHYKKPKFLRTLLTDKPLADKCSKVLDALYEDLLAYNRELRAQNVPDNALISAQNISENVYSTACSHFERSTGMRPLRPKGDISITATRGLY